MRLGLGLGVGAGGGAAAWTPAKLSGLKLWLRADLGITLNGSNVSSWADQSGNDNDFSQGTAGKQPTYTAAGGPNGKPGLDFSTNDTLTRSGFADAATSYTVAVVLTQRTLTNDQQLFGGSGNRNICETSFGASDLLAFYTSAARLTFGSATTGSQALLWLMDGANVSCYKNNVQSGTTQARLNIAYITQAWIGSNQDLGGYINAILGELVIYTRALTSDERTKLQTYFAARYAL